MSHNHYLSLSKISFNDIITNSEWSQDSNLLLITFNKQTFCEDKSLDSQD